MEENKEEVEIIKPVEIDLSMFIDTVKLSYLNLFKIEREINNHSIAYIKAKISEADAKSLLNRKEEIVTINGYIDNNNNNEYNGKENKDEKENESTTKDEKDKIYTLFRGSIKDVSIERDEGEHFYCDITVISTSFDTDLNKNNRSFQDITKTYQDILNFNKATTKISKLSEEKNYKCLPEICDSTKKSKAINNIIMQYQETDWEFLLRMANNLQLPVIVDDISESEYIYIGFKEGKSQKVEYISYELESDYNKNIRCICYSYQIFSIGDSVVVDNKEYVVIESLLKYSNYCMNGRYVLAEKEDYIKNIKIQKHIKIAGKGIRAVVKSNEDKDGLGRLEVDFMFEDEKGNLVAEGYKGTRYQIPLMTPYMSGADGWFMVPEIGSEVLVTFPNETEGNCYIGGVYRKSGDAGKYKPTAKILRTKEGREISMDETGVKLSAVKDGMEVVMTEKVLTLTAGKSKIKMNDSGIEISTGGTKVVLDGSKITAKGNEVDLQGASHSSVVT